METLNIPSEADFKKWINQALSEFFENHPLLLANTPTVIEPPFLNRKQVAAIFGISLVTLHDWMNNGFPFHRQGGRVYFIRAEIVDYVKEHKNGSNSRKTYHLTERRRRA